MDEASGSERPSGAGTAGFFLSGGRLFLVFDNLEINNSERPRGACHEGIFRGGTSQRLADCGSVLLADYS